MRCDSTTTSYGPDNKNDNEHSEVFLASDSQSNNISQAPIANISIHPVAEATTTLEDCFNTEMV